jgi:hypothetical protein
MIHYLKNTWFLLVACLVLQELNATSQVMTPSEMWSNIAIRAEIARSNVNAAAEYRRLHPDKEGLEWASNVLRDWKPAGSWPESSKKKDILEHCAAVLHSAMDPKAIELATSELTNQANALEIKEFLKVAASNLKEYATMLTSPEISTSVEQYGYLARLSIAGDDVSICFWPETNGLPRLVRDIERRVPADRRHLVVAVRFYENGKLQEFRVNSPDRKVVLFDKQGYLYHYGGPHPYWALNRIKALPREKP